MRPIIPRSARKSRTTKGSNTQIIQGTGSNREKPHSNHRPPILGGSNVTPEKGKGDSPCTPAFRREEDQPSARGPQGGEKNQSTEGPGIPGERRLPADTAQDGGKLSPDTGHHYKVVEGFVEETEARKKSLGDFSGLTGRKGVSGTKKRGKTKWEHT